MAEEADARERAQAFDRRLLDVFGYFKEINSAVLKCEGAAGDYTCGFLGAISSLGLPQPGRKDWRAWSAIMDTVDANGVGMITLDDFRFIVEQQQQKVLSKQDLMAAFRNFEEVGLLWMSQTHAYTCHTYLQPC
jgi:hypothetical protein